MPTYAITGAAGFLGWHLRCRLRAERPSAKVRLLGRGDLDAADDLAEKLHGCDAILHLAAVNSHDPEAVAANRDLAEALVGGLSKAGSAPHVVYANSSHVERDTAYGRSKAAAAAVLERWAATSGAAVSNVILPNLFGECGRPNYNSAVATFCHAITRGVTPEVDPDGFTELLHAQEASSVLLRHAEPRSTGTERVPGESIAVTDVYDRLRRFHDEYRGTHRVPRLPTVLDVRLFNQLRVAMFPQSYPVPLTAHGDARGSFFEAVRGSGDGQTSFSTSVPGATRGDHWHIDKVERFLVVRGEAVIEIRRMFDDVVHSFAVSGDSPAFVDMPTLHTHRITNLGDDELLTMFWANDHFDPDLPDTYPEPVRLAEFAR